MNVKKHYLYANRRIKEDWSYTFSWCASIKKIGAVQNVLSFVRWTHLTASVDSFKIDDFIVS